MENVLLKENEAAKIISVSPATLRNWRYKKVGPKYLKIGKLVRYKQEHILEFLSSCSK